jgi:tyrosyl-tRNA synthetase
MQGIFDSLVERGYIAQATHEDNIRTILNNEKVTFYVGFDPTADSLHVGHFIPIVVMMHMQKAGHRPIALVGGGTTMVGDPSGRTDLRTMMTIERIDQNALNIRAQLAKFLHFDSGAPNAAIMVNNADWLRGLNYIEFLRDIGAMFSVNRMLTAECYKSRLEQGLTFLEFNYMLMQSYDFLHMFRTHNCILQTGGDDQWSNILAGADLIRRKEREDAFALTFKLLLTSSGAKMGKTEKGTVWLDSERTSPYDFYQYWRNVDDGTVENCLALLTFFPMEEVKRLGRLKDAEINNAKRVLAFEVTRQVHGDDAAAQAQEAADALFMGGGSGGSIPTTIITAGQLSEDNRLSSLAVLAGLCASKGEARKLMTAGGLYVGEDKMIDLDARVTPEQLAGEGLLLRKGKKAYHRLRLE